MSEQKNSFGQPIGREVPNWVERGRPPREATAGRYRCLESVHVDQHVMNLFDAYKEAPDARDWTYLSVERPESAERFRSYLTDLAKSDDPLHFAIVSCATGRPLGTAALMGIDTAHGVIEIGNITYSPRL